ncbi:KIR protein [Plasmodium coatneyi]|uniref:KIR protein n=1 Tax=Plasmodium coatneyi TaxID=208452 RepID=A0A1B1DYM8_9APIC|nr:KIR protein [Plasmodium coatneyi]ANQ07687.1 KIR protein [Plasmodium coatneyi]
MAEKTCRIGSITETLTLDNSFYSNFESNTEGYSGDGGTEGSGVAQLKSQLGITCSHCTKIIDDAAKIDNAYLYACQQNGKQDYGDAPCRLFYYWFGHKYWPHLNGKTLSEILDKIYTTLENTSSCTSGTKCKFKYEEIDETTFEQMKGVFGYYHDYSEVQRELGTTAISCAKEWANYWTTLSTACKTMKDKCTGDSGHNVKSYCKDFNTTYAVHCDIANLHQEMEVLIKKIQREANEARNKATTTSSLSSIFGILGTIGAPLLLYKYKPWSSWFGNHSSGSSGRSNRRRRSTIRNGFDTLTEASATTVSTIADSTKMSTIYDRSPPKRGTRAGTNTTNNNTPGHHQRTNFE